MVNKLLVNEKARGHFKVNKTMKSREEVATWSQRGEPWLRDAGKMRAMSESDAGVRRIYIKKKSTVIREQPEPGCSEGAQPGPL